MSNDKTTMVTEHLDDCNTDIALLTETWLNNGDLITKNDLTPPEFDFETKKKQKNKNKGWYSYTP